MSQFDNWKLDDHCTLVIVMHIVLMVNFKCCRKHQFTGIENTMTDIDDQLDIAKKISTDLVGPVYDADLSVNHFKEVVMHAEAIRQEQETQVLLSAGLGKILLKYIYDTDAVYSVSFRYLDTDTINKSWLKMYLRYR